ncbi:gamma-glutamyl-gamma-aminobutyrate hydrolase family protein [Rivibacter subsaxonicus]|uniref:gamma-glutamyl-gamma-aminobutyrate hydrolase n=1 Tax=Rivibacter subsaxonicus TaxID=457575 RepID=A0A4Q7VAM8_9BURK|nr:gamma-glutamyl-gamma-aminobutyrate hydrolase family protein [Rivibacter subsaxonicus]RZT93821.1 gamma-glutamyl-gamma-aminobutyrate hydrolase [Rivibacter subsaxonicus]
MTPAVPSPSTTRRPLVLVPACNRLVGAHPFHIAGQKYIDAVRLAGCLPLVVPAAQPHEVDELLDLADGVFLTGSPSNVHPRHFDEVVHDPALPLDPRRDDWTLPLIPRALERGIPLFAICRGFQEANVALGGALHQAVQEQPGLMDHRSRDGDPVDLQYGPVHPVMVEPGGVLETLLGHMEFPVNSLHGQGIKRLAPGLRVEARAPDGLVEAFSQPAANGFNLAVQWHPEWQAQSNPISVKLLRAFGDACRTFRERNRESVRERPRVP